LINDGILRQQSLDVYIRAEEGDMNRKKEKESGGRGRNSLSAEEVGKDRIKKEAEVYRCPCEKQRNWEAKGE
jgi:hypothetical protein